MGLATPERIRTLQRKLYVKAKGDDTRSPGGGPGVRRRMSRLHALT